MTHTPPIRINTEKREGGDQFTHKWKIYVCGPAEDPEISHFIKKVRFFLHPSYKPNDIIEITHSPFTLTRWGWGEFPIRVQLHLRSSHRKTIDIIHQLLLDKSLTGSQVLGSERPYTVEIDRTIVEQKDLSDETVNPAEPLQKIEEVVCQPITINNDKILTKSPGMIEFESKLDNLIHSIIEDYPLIRKGNPLLKVTRMYCIEWVYDVHLFHDALIRLLIILIHDMSSFFYIVSYHNRLLPYTCAGSLKEYFEWNIGKRKAVEVLEFLADDKFRHGMSLILINDIVFFSICSGREHVS